MRSRSQSSREPVADDAEQRGDVVDVAVRPSASSVMSSAAGSASSAATRRARSAGTPSAVEPRRLRVVPARARCRAAASGSTSRDAVDARGEEARPSRATGSGRRRWRRSQRLARSTSLRRLEIHRGLRVDRDRRRRAPRSSCHSAAWPKIARAASWARTISAAVAPVSSASRNANVVPARLTMPFTSAVAMISRRSGCVAIRVEEALARRRAGSTARARARSRGRRGARLASSSSSSVILAYASSTASSGAVRPRPGVAAVGELLVVGEALDRAVEVARLLERAHEARVHVFHLGAPAPRALSSARFWR